ncbi:peptidyl-prolyl cis-trans isomerase [Aureococcus anophagefferens]|uniref:Peptidyl-prolyl cis-trans isomerase n=1 Tax=Aureococcus anophagefferens TaxID=44056 RepID=A0ABR1G716_AURAN
MRSSAVLLCLLWLQAVAGGDDRRSLAEDAAPEVEMVTSLGSMRFMLTPQMTPATVSNFLAYVDDGFFDGLIFHRVIENFTVQGGGFDAAMHQRATRDPIPLEAASAMSNGRGTTPWRRANVAASATSQFFVNHKDNANLDASSTSQGYAVFGFRRAADDRATRPRGLATPTPSPPSRRARVTVDGHAFQNVPVEPVLITSVRRVGPAPTGDGRRDGRADAGADGAAPRRRRRRLRRRDEREAGRRDPIPRAVRRQQPAGTIAMARTNHPDSAASEFFINHADNKFLDSRSNHNGYCAFA